MRDEGVHVFVLHALRRRCFQITRSKAEEREIEREREELIGKCPRQGQGHGYKSLARLLPREVADTPGLYLSMCLTRRTIGNRNGSWISNAGAGLARPLARARHCVTLVCTSPFLSLHDRVPTRAGLFSQVPDRSE